MSDLEVVNAQGSRMYMIVRTVLCEALEYRITRGYGSTVIHVSPKVPANRVGEIVARELIGEENYSGAVG